MSSVISDPDSATAPDLHWMRRALRLASEGLCTTTPNPRVGCVLVRDGRMVGEGWHERAGAPHAEAHALRAAGAAAHGSTAYVTLEPCSHTGRTGPCCEALIAAGVAEVVVAMQDPNPLVSGQGIARLRAAGIAVRVGVEALAAERLNRGFVSRMTRGRPWLRLKLGLSLDGRTALANGVSQWITSAESRHDVHRQRAQSCAVLTGLGTVLADDPALTVRHVDTRRQPLRILIDANLQAPATAQLFQGGNTLVLAAQPVVEDGARGALRTQQLRAQGVEVQAVPARSCVDRADAFHLDLPSLCLALGQRQLNEVLVEAGAGLNGALLQAGVVDECLFYLAPTLLGDGARGPAALGPFLTLDACPALRFGECIPIGPDLRLTAYPEPRSQRAPAAAPSS